MPFIQRNDLRSSCMRSSGAFPARNLADRKEGEAGRRKIGPRITPLMVAPGLGVPLQKPPSYCL